MFKKISLAVLAAATAMTALPAAAEARHYRDGYNEYRSGQRFDGQRYSRYRHAPRYYGRNYYGRNYYGRNYYRGRCRDSGATGTILGAIAGGLLGHEIAEGGRYRRGDGTTGAIVGAGAGALIGRSIDRDC